MDRTIRVFVKPLAASATAVHNGTNGQGYPPKLEGFVVQPTGDVHFGGPGTTGATNGYTILNGQSVNILGFLSRGSFGAYDLTQLYYVGGPWKLVIEDKV